MKQQTTGFTLIELIIVVAVILIISVVTILNYNSFNDKQRVKQAGYTLRSDLRLARTKATSVQKPITCMLRVFDGYTAEFFVDCSGKGSCYKLYPVCTPALTQAEKDSETQTVYLPQGIVFAPSLYPSILFSSLTGVTNLAADQLLVLSGAGVTYTVRVTPSGVVSDY